MADLMISDLCMIIVRRMSRQPLKSPVYSSSPDSHISWSMCYSDVMGGGPSPITIMANGQMRRPPASGMRLKRFQLL